MGKIIRAQRIGKGTRRKVPSHKFKADVQYLPLKLSKEKMKGKVLDILNDPGRTAPIAKVKYSNGTSSFIIAPLNLKVNDEVWFGSDVESSNGSILMLGEIPEGTLICNVEAVPGDGGKFARASGTYAKVVTHNKSTTVVQLPSGSFKVLNSKCRATIGVVAGSGRIEKPFVKAGNKFKALRARGKLYPIVKGIAMNARDHPFGGGNHPHTGKSKSISRHTPPGRKVGSIASRKTGKRK